MYRVLIVIPYTYLSELVIHSLRDRVRPGDLASHRHRHQVTYRRHTFDASEIGISDYKLKCMNFLEKGITGTLRIQQPDNVCTDGTAATSAIQLQYFITWSGSIAEHLQHRHISQKKILVLYCDVYICYSIIVRYSESLNTWSKMGSVSYMFEDKRVTCSSNNKPHQANSPARFPADCSLG